MEQVLDIKINGKATKEEIWLSIESPLKLFLEKTFESKFLHYISMILNRINKKILV